MVKVDYGELYEKLTLFIKQLVTCVGIIQQNFTLEIKY